MRILLVYYSQSGDAARVADALAESLRGPETEVVTECIRPRASYPYPWRNVLRFFSVLPECLLGPPPAIEPPSYDPNANYDLIVLVYQVWFLSPSLPIQGYLASDAARVLRGRKVMTVSVSRNMWQSASETMKARLRDLGAVQVDNIVVTHQGPPWATFITTPRALLFGQKGPFWKIFPPAGIAEGELERIRGFGRAVRQHFDRLRDPAPRSLLQGLGAVHVNRRYMIPEFLGWYLFRAWARVLSSLGRPGSWARSLGVVLFILFLVTAVVVGIPLVILGSLLLSPLINRLARPYAERLAAPSGVPLPTGR